MNPFVLVERNPSHIVSFVESKFILCGNNTVLAAFQLGRSSTSSLYRVDLTTGSAGIVGPIGGSVALCISQLHEAKHPARRPHLITTATARRM